jgi:hypothetical protein
MPSQRRGVIAQKVIAEQARASAAGSPDVQ